MAGYAEWRHLCAESGADDRVTAATGAAASNLRETSIMTVFKYDHVHLRSPDPEATARFYENMFGAEVSRGLYPAGTPFAGQPRVTMKLGGTSFFIAPTDPRVPNGDPPKAPHFAWNISA
jgi:hypothetical protein